MKLAVLLAAAALPMFSASAFAVDYNQTFALQGNGTGSSGFGAAQVSIAITSTNTLSWSIIYTGLSGSLTGADLRDPSNAVAVNLAGAGSSGLTSSPLTGTATLTSNQVSSIENSGQWKITLDTARFPTGEISGALPATTTNGPVPEPASLGLLAIGTAALMVKMRRRVG